jgi:FkbM family methyltransferase
VTPLFSIRWWSVANSKSPLTRRRHESLTLAPTSELPLASFFERWPDASVLAIELEERNFELLVRNSSMYERAIVKLGALWGRKGWLNLADPNVPALEFSAIEPAGDSVGTIPSFGIEDLLDEVGWDTVDLVKLDIEGGEIPVFNA